MIGRTPSVLTRFCCSGLHLSWIRGVPSEGGKNYALHFWNCHFFTRTRSEVLGNRRNTKPREGKVTVEKKVKSGGSDPTFSAFSRPKSSWGRSRPPAGEFVPSFFPR